jgi:hypothetical protein
VSEPRDDLAGLGDEQLVALANAGLLKRARREVDAGRGPSIELRDDGSLVGRSPDGAISEIGRDIAAKLGVCSCGAPRACRHRLATILAYRAERGEATEQAWDPGGFSDEELVRHLGQDSVDAARVEMAASLAVTVSPGSLPVAELPTATVSFWVPRSLSLCRCDCGHAPCTHIALAVWAFRSQPQAGLVVLGAARSAAVGSALALVDQAVSVILAEGVASYVDEALVARARAACFQERLSWLGDALEDLERDKDSYQRRSTVFRVESAVAHLAEVVARTRAATAPQPTLPASYVLGSEQSAGGKTDSLRLVGLGAAVESDGKQRIVRAYFVEPISNTVLALHKEWDFGESEPPVGRQLGELFASSRRSLRDLCTGYTVARGARRRDNGVLDLDRARSLRPSQPAGDMWGEIVAPIRVTSLAEHEARIRDRPPALLGPRMVGRGVHVLEVRQVVAMGYSASHQELRAVVEDGEGTRCAIDMHHRAASPGRVDALFHGLVGAPTLAAGRLGKTADGWRLRVFAFCDPRGRVVVPDLEGPRPTDKPSDMALFFTDSSDGGPFAELARVVERAVHRGRGAVASRGLPELAARFASAGLLDMAALCRRALTDGEAFRDLLVASVLAREHLPSEHLPSEGSVAGSPS